MSICYITFRSITGAQLGAKLLEQFHIHHHMMRAPQTMAKNGCGYALKIKGQDFQNALEILRRGNAPYQRLYGDFGLGKVEDLGL